MNSPCRTRLHLLFSIAASLLLAASASAQFSKLEAEDYFAQGGIRTEGTSDDGGGLNIAFISNDDWAEYSVDIPSAGDYEIDFRVASDSIGGSLGILSNGNSLGSVPVSGTGGWQTWETISTVVNFAASGPQTLRLNFTGQSGISLFNVNWFTLVQAPVSIEAEDYTAHSGVQIEPDKGETTDSIGYIDAGDWADYSVEIPIAGDYLVTFYASTRSDGGDLELALGGSMLGSLFIPDTDQWYDWMPYSMVVNFPSSGPQTIRLNFVSDTNAGALFNLDRFVISLPEPVQLAVDDERQQMMRYGMDYERLWYWTGTLNASERDTVAKWSVVDCDIDYIRVAINSKYELTEGSYNGNTFELYDLLADASEQTNIAAANPAIVTRMTEEFQAWQTAVDTDVEYIAPADAPSVVISTAPGAVGGPFDVDVVFSESVTGLAAGNFDITNGLATGLAGSGDTYTLAVTPTVEGLVTISLPAGSAQDADSNPSLVSNTLNVFFGNAASSILIDFGRTDNQTTEGNFNNVYGTGTGLDTPTVELIDSEGADTGITLNVDFSAGGSWSGSSSDYLGPYPDAVASHPQTAVQDSMFIRAPASSTLTFTGLDTAKAYDILIYGARSNNGGPNSEWTFTDASGDTLIAFDVFNNATEVASFEGLVPDENNALTLLYTSTDDGSRPRGAMSFMQITAVSDSSSRFEITGIEIDPTSGAPTNTVTWTSLPDRTYGLYYSTDLQNWEEISASIASEGDTTSFDHQLLPDFSELVGVPRLFYRAALIE